MSMHILAELHWCAQNPQLHLGGVPILCTLNPVRFLSLNVQVCHTSSLSKNTIHSKLNAMMTEVEKLQPPDGRSSSSTPEVCPYLSWLLLIQEFPTSWVVKQLDSITARYLKRWTGLSKPANIAILYMPRSMGGLKQPAF